MFNLESRSQFTSICTVDYITIICGYDRNAAALEVIWLRHTGQLEFNCPLQSSQRHRCPQGSNITSRGHSWQTTHRKWSGISLSRAFCRLDRRLSSSRRCISCLSHRFFRLIHRRFPSRYPKITVSPPVMVRRILKYNLF